MLCLAVFTLEVEYVYLETETKRNRQGDTYCVYLETETKRNTQGDTYNICLETETCIYILYIYYITTKKGDKKGGRDRKTAENTIKETAKMRQQKETDRDRQTETVGEQRQVNRRQNKPAFSC